MRTLTYTASVNTLTNYLHCKGLLGWRTVGYGELLVEDTYTVPQTLFLAPGSPDPSLPMLQHSLAQLPAGPGQGLAWAALFMDHFVSLPAEAGKSTWHKKSSLIQFSPTHFSCSKGHQKKREECRVFMATIWAALTLLEEEHGKPRQGNSFLSDGVTELTGTWLLQESAA